MQSISLAVSFNGEAALDPQFSKAEALAAEIPDAPFREKTLTDLAVYRGE